MLDVMDEVCEFLDIATLVDNSTLVDDATTIQSLVDEVCSNTENLYTIIHSILNSVCTLKRWQERRMDVHNALCIALQEHLTHDTHIARKTYELHAALVEHIGNNSLELLA